MSLIICYNAVKRGRNDKKNIGKVLVIAGVFIIVFSMKGAYQKKGEYKALNDEKNRVVEIFEEGEYQQLSAQYRKELYYAWKNDIITTEQYDEAIKKIGTKEHVLEVINADDYHRLADKQSGVKKDAYEYIIAALAGLGVGVAGASLKAFGEKEEDEKEKE